MNNGSKLKFDLLAVLLILCIFSAAVLSLLLSGAKVYKNMTEKDRISQEEQIESLYISNRIFQAKSRDEVRIEEQAGIEMLTVYSAEEGEAYITRVYFYDGWIRELYSSVQYNFDPTDGEKIAKAKALDFDLDDGLLKVTIETEDGTSIRYFDMKGAKE